MLRSSAPMVTSTLAIVAVGSFVVMKMIRADFESRHTR